MPVDEYTSNLRAIIEHIQGAGAEHILLLTPPPLHEPARLKYNQEARMHWSVLLFTCRVSFTFLHADS